MSIVSFLNPSPMNSCEDLLQIYLKIKIKLTTGILTYRTVFSLTKNVRLGSSNEGVELTIGQNVLE